MRRRLAWVCGGLAVAGLLAWRIASSETGNAAVEAGSRADRPSSPPMPATAAWQRLQDDSLPPPSADASPAERRAYGSAIDAIIQGDDPVVQAPSSTLPAEQLAAIQERREMRRKMAIARANEGYSRAKERKAEIQKRREVVEKRRALDPPGPRPPEIDPPLARPTVDVQPDSPAATLKKPESAPK